MNQSLIVKPYLAKAACDLDDATASLSTCWTAEDHDAIGRLTNTTEAIARAIASVSLAVERLAELVIDD
jgi:hypothetical protein